MSINLQSLAILETAFRLAIMFVILLCISAFGVRMSHSVAIVLPPVPTDDENAWGLLDSLIEEQGPRPEVFQTLHDQLTAHYPCLSSLSDDDVDDGVWSDGPLINNFGHRAAVLGLAFSHVEEVMPFLITTAIDLGLIVFDMQANAVHRPGPMSLQVESGLLIYGVTEANLRRYIEEEAFAILSINDDTYIQCAEQSEPPYEYILEYQDGSIDRHYRAVAESITLDEVLAAFVKYVRQDASWMREFRWEKMDLS